MVRRSVARLKDASLRLAALACLLGDGWTVAGAAAGESAEPAAVAAAGDVGVDAGIPFDGLGLEGFGGVGSIASELRRLEEASLAGEAWALGMAVSGPGGSAGRAGEAAAGPAPLTAMFRSTVSGIDFSAGLDADPGTIQSGPARWIGGVKVATEGSLGRAELALRTTVRYAEASRLIGLEVGPRFERAFPGGLTFFLDGKAEAETAASPEQRIWTPSSSNFDGIGSLGVVGRTGIVR